MKDKIRFDGALSLKNDKANFLGKDKIELLKAVEACGSISQAARAVGISYKTAWDSIDLMNNLYKEILVEKVVGGMHGGGARLTPKARETLELFDIVEEEHKKFLDRLSKRMRHPTELLNFLRRIAVRTSARNQFYGKVKGILRGAVNSEVTLSLKGNQEIIATITNQSVQNLGLKTGMSAYALIKASFILLSTDRNLSISAENRLEGTVLSIAEGSVNDEVSIELSGGNVMISILTSQARKNLQLEVGKEIYAFFSASSVILAVE
ncbi:LysR family transcriptional regulator [Leptospira fletcheri]|uniref:LysR family transcriptional regulator n=1 Tax=Leptospira fletcheri TaxID=2484981 RepID=A0A4R9GI27_9LEPT|nr:TOBE domain-containing protein [Leptospira fletcheri]TGK12424.1 LysR family transcriptional regulator [Leptospira fletcheri]